MPLARAMIVSARANPASPTFPSGHWASAARAMEQAGAQAIELNLYSVPSDTRRSNSSTRALRALRENSRRPKATFFSTVRWG